MLINSNDELHQYIPNAIREIKGETPLYDKLKPFLQQAESWFTLHFVPSTMLEDVREMAAPIIVTEAYRLAIPQLDLVLTANGFATVGTQNLAPASKMRADRLVGGLLTQRDAALDILLARLPLYEPWLLSNQARWFASTLFPFLNVVMEVGITEPLWQQYQRLRPRIVDIENCLANEFFSQELLAALRPAVQRGSIDNPTRQHFVETLRFNIINIVAGQPMDRHAMIDLVNYIRQNPEDFAEWHASDTAELFSPEVFKNNRFSSGYWF